MRRPPGPPAPWGLGKAAVGEFSPGAEVSGPEWGVAGQAGGQRDGVPDIVLEDRRLGLVSCSGSSPTRARVLLAGVVVSSGDRDVTTNKEPL